MTASGNVSLRRKVTFLLVKLAYAQPRIPEWLLIDNVTVDMGRRIGEGTFSNVFKGVYQGQAVAVKEPRVNIQLSEKERALHKVQGAFYLLLCVLSLSDRQCVERPSSGSI